MSDGDGAAANAVFRLDAERVNTPDLVETGGYQPQAIVHIRIDICCLPFGDAQSGIVVQLVVVDLIAAGFHQKLDAVWQDDVVDVRIRREGICQPVVK